MSFLGDFRRRCTWASVASLVALTSALAGAQEGPVTVDVLSRIITRMDLAEAGRILEEGRGGAPVLAERARWLIYQGRCEEAAAVLATPAVARHPAVPELRAIADGCLGVMAEASVLEDRELGVWVRYQDVGDYAIIPYLMEAAAAARDQLGMQLGVTLPRPLRIELVRDLYSLSRMTGLPVDAAETTGTIAVARWGKITLVSPRAPLHGFHWEDTLAHEIVHLLLTRASDDRAPLWLQEGIAKRFERAWRPERPWDRDEEDDVVAAAWKQGRSIGLQGLGQSIAMLPSADDAALAYAEVSSFTSFLLSEAGVPALRLLLWEVAALGESHMDAALRSVTGYDLPQWERRWRAALERRTPQAPAHASERPLPVAQRRLAVRARRLAELLEARGKLPQALPYWQRAGEAQGTSSELRARWSRSLLWAGKLEEAQMRLGEAKAFREPDPLWLILASRLGREGSPRWVDWARGVDPYEPWVACEGEPEHFARFEVGSPAAILCDEARRRPRHP